MLQYEVEFEGRRYFGNIIVKEFHVFQFLDDFYLFDVHRVKPYKISEADYLTLSNISPHSINLVTDETMNTLKLFDILEENENVPLKKGLINDYNNVSNSLLSHIDKVELKQTPIGISNIALFVAQKCNMRCVYCYGDGGGFGEDESLMSQEDAFIAIDWLFKESINSDHLRISFFGGEPLLNFPLIKNVVEYAKKKAEMVNKTVTFDINTNATLLTDEIINYLKRENIKPIISLDGPPEIHNKQRPLKNGCESHNIIISYINRLVTECP